MKYGCHAYAPAPDYERFWFPLSPLPCTYTTSPIHQVTPVHTILASNTSSISITKLGSTTSKPHRVVSTWATHPMVCSVGGRVIRGTRSETAKGVGAANRGMRQQQQ